MLLSFERAKVFPVALSSAIRLFVVFGEIIGNTGGGRFHGLFAFFPVGGADVSMFFMELEGVDHTQGFLGITPQGQIIDYRMANNTVSINEKGPAQGYARFKQDSVSAEMLLSRSATSGY
jgi:hypothetical protein